MQTGYELVEEVPDADTYRALRVAAGMKPRSAEAAAAGLPHTLFAAVVKHQGAIVGMGRVVGDGGCCFVIDGGCCFVITDMAVQPAHQGRGIGKAIFRHLVDWLHATVPVGAHISLLADGEAHRLYAQFGFQPSAPASIGMELHIR